MSANVATETGFLPVDQGKLYYEVAGTGRPLLLIHADVADTRMWDEQFAAFARHYRVIRYDKRTFGQTTTANGTFSFRDDILALLAHLGITKTAVLGLSNGGALALDFTLEHPELVDALIVVAGGVSGVQEVPDPPTAAEEALFAQYEALENSPEKDYDALTELGVHAWGDGPNQPEGRADASVRERLRTMIANNYRLHGSEEVKSKPLDPPAVGRLGEVRVPTLVIVGDYDESATIAMMNMLAVAVPGARKVVFPGTAHMVNMEQPERFNATVLGFLASV
ncbi:MAG TPA: alpha/beta hydrolase [Ktedonobacterales bacterium]